MRHRNARPIGTSPRTRLVHAGAAIVAIGLTAALVSACAATDDLAKPGRLARAGGHSRARCGANPTCKASGDMKAPFHSTARGVRGTGAPDRRGSGTEGSCGERAGRESAAGLEGAEGRRSISESPIRGNEHNSFWQDHGRPRKVYKQTSLIVEPRDGRVPYTPDARKAEARAATRMAWDRSNRFSIRIRANGVSTDGVTGMMWQGPNGGHNQIVQSPGYVTILRGVPGSPPHPDRRASTRQHPAMVRRFRWPLGGRHARRRYHQLSRPDELRMGQHLDAPIRDAASRRTVHADRCRNARVQDHRRGSGDVLLALDGRHSHLAPRRRYAHLRIRVS